MQFEVILAVKLLVNGVCGMVVLQSGDGVQCCWICHHISPTYFHHPSLPYRTCPLGVSVGQHLFRDIWSSKGFCKCCAANWSSWPFLCLSTPSTQQGSVSNTDFCGMQLLLNSRHCLVAELTKLFMFLGWSKYWLSPSTQGFICISRVGREKEELTAWFVLIWMPWWWLSEYSWVGSDVFKEFLLLLKCSAPWNKERIAGR